MSNLRDELRARNKFITLEVGEEFTGVYKGFEFVQSNFEDKEVAELQFEVDGRDKIISGAALAFEVSNFAEGDSLRVKKLSKKGNKISWLVEKVAAVVRSKVEEVKDADEPGIDIKDIPF